jgi:hypothetical protein
MAEQFENLKQRDPTEYEEIMNKRPALFLSYSRNDEESAAALEKALEARGLRVWRDVRNISAGERWHDAIEDGVRKARAVVVLVTETSAKSEWVTYEYALATGAGVPVVAVVADGAEIPAPIQKFQIVRYSRSRQAAEEIDDGIQNQSRSTGHERALVPKLIAKFQEENGKLCPVSATKIPPLWIDLWVEHAPRQTHSVAFEIPDYGFRDRKWKVSRAKLGVDSFREFLTDDMNSYGDVEIWARGIGHGPGNWSTKSRLYEALDRYYSGGPASSDIRRGLKQIREN